ncbi:MAG: MutS-related protein family 1 [Labilithrix sp.]|nr:MutS-related protein family 1 [Labilithrix sp.]
MPSTTSPDAKPQEIHQAALKARSEVVASLEARANVIATARLVVFGGAIALLAAIVFAHLPSNTWLGVVGLVLAFGVLVVVHARVHEAKERKVAAVRFHERALARMAGKWRAFTSIGEKWAVDTHPYAGDLDVFGKASLFQLLDATSTRFGEEVLARWLSGDAATPVAGDGAPDFAEAIRARQAAVKDLAPRVAVREELAVVGSLLDEGKPDPRPFVMWAGQSGAAQSKGLPGSLRIVAVLMPVLTIGTAVLASIGLVPRAAFILPFALCIVILASLRPRLAPNLEAASSKETALSRYAGMLAILENEPFEAPALVALQKRLRESGASATKEMASLSRIVGFLDARNNEVFRFFIGPMLMWDLWCALALDRWRARAGRVAFGWFRALAELEALASLAGFAFERPDHTFPEIVPEATFEAVTLGHPLIEAEKRVSNDVSVAGPGYALVVTGSNMSGKSTLLRAMGINVVLANAGAPVCAKSMRVGRIVVATSMRVSDSLDEGTSRFYAELKKLKLVLDLARKSKKSNAAEGTVLFLLDEILHGTNTRERLIGARAILRELLAQGAMGAVSTHDLGLGDLETEMPEHVRNVHFEEQVNGDVMTFDYKLRKGIVQSSNALRLMKIVGLDVVEG